MKGMVDGAAVGALGVLPAEILAPSAMAGGAGHFFNQDHHSVSAVAGGAGHFFASQNHSSVSAVALKTDAQIARQKEKKKRWRKNKKRRINAHQAISPLMIHQEGKTLCVFHQKGFSGWCARGNYDCTCCEGATINFRKCIVKLRLV